jgi:hypothetical protein
MSRRLQIYVLAGLLVTLAAVYFFNRSSVPGIAGVAADGKFTPLSVQEPQLRLDLLDKLSKEEYAGSHRNIFSAVPPPPEPTVIEKKRQEEAKYSGDPFPQKEIIPPLEVPAEFFGFASMPNSGRKVAFFKNGDDVMVVAEGDTLMNRFRLLHMGTDSADVEEISTGRKAKVPLVQPVGENTAGPGPTPSPNQNQ